MRHFFLFLFLLIEIACSTSPTGRRRILFGVNDEDMNQMGIKAFDEIKSKTPIENNPRTNAYVKCIANSILAVINDDTGVKAWEIVVFRDDTANAFALPGGKIGVHTGILPVTKTPGQLAAVLGHEVAHVLARHGEERVSEAGLMDKAMGAIGGVTGNNPAVMGALGAGAKFGVMLPFSRAHESEADVLGLDYMSLAGFDPKQSVELWKNMGALGGGKPPEIISTHPSDETRIKNLQDHMDGAIQTYTKARSSGKNPQCN